MNDDLTRKHGVRMRVVGAMLAAIAGMGGSVGLLVAPAEAAAATIIVNPAATPHGCTHATPNCLTFTGAAAIVTTFVGTTVTITIAKGTYATAAFAKITSKNAGAGGVVVQGHGSGGATLTKLTGGLTHTVMELSSTGTTKPIKVQNLVVAKGFANLPVGGGGGIVNFAKHATIDNVAFDTNKTSAGFPTGGAAWISATTLTSTFTGDFFSGNVAFGSGGAIYDQGKTITVSKSSFTANSTTTGTGGAIYITSATPSASITKDTFSQNQASGTAKEGGAIYLANVTVGFGNDTFYKNGTKTATRGSSIAAFKSSTHLNFDTFSGTSHTTAIWSTTPTGSAVDETIFNHVGCSGAATLIGASSSTFDIGTMGAAAGMCFIGEVTNPGIHLSSILAANGSTGPKTLAIGTNSAAFELVTAGCSPTDERGDPRPGVPGQNCDAGAYEFQQASSLALPGPVTNLTGLSASGSVTASWTAPTVTGGSVVSGYRATLSPCSISCTKVLGAATKTATFTSLKNGVAYAIAVAAVNATGVGPSSSVTEIPATQPGAPTLVSATAGNAKVTLHWTAPASNGGSAITTYAITETTVVIAFTVGPTTLSYIATPLTNTTLYKFRVYAVNGKGFSPGSVQLSATPHATPAAPVITTAKSTVTGHKIKVTFTHPAPNGTTIHHYKLTATPTAGGSATSVTVLTTKVTGTITGLAPGTSYNVTVAAEFTAATVVGPASAPTSVTTFNVPTAPVLFSAVGANKSVKLTWSAPSSNGGSVVTGYKVTKTGVATATGSTATTKTVTGLTNGTTYHFKVIAVNAVGTSPASDTLAATPSSAPTAPKITAAVSGTTGTKIKVTFTHPAANTTTIKHYKLTATPTGVGTPTSVIVLTTRTTGTITPLLKGTTYNVTVAAEYTAGTTVGPASTPVTVTTFKAPGQPSAVIAIANGNGSVTLSWSAPATNGTPITAYTVTVTTGTTFSGLPHTTGSATTNYTIPKADLTAGHKYSFKVRAKNAVSYGIYSSPSNIGTAIGTPGKPTSVAGTANPNGTVKVKWTPPATAGATITTYTVSIHGTTTCPTCTGTVVTGNPAQTFTTITGLTLGGSYTFTVTASSIGGTSPSSTPSNKVTPYTPPAAPTGVNVTLGLIGKIPKVTIAWTDPPPNGTVLKGYWLRAKPANTLGTIKTHFVAGAGAISGTITNLTPGTTYYVTVSAEYQYLLNPIATGPTSSPADIVTTWNVPTAPSAVSPIADPTGGITFVWAASATNGSTITSYTIKKISGTPGALAFPIVTGSSTTTFFITKTYFLAGKAYTFAVIATNGVGTSVASSTSEPVTDIGPPKKPTKPVATALSNGSVKLTWIVPVGATQGATITKYTITPTPACALCTGLVLTGNPAVAKSTITGLTPGTSYTFTVRATNISTTSPSPTSTSSNAAIPYTTPTAPTGVKAKSTVTGTKITVTFVHSVTNGTTIQGYRLYATPQSGFGVVKTKTVGSGVTTGVIGTVLKGTAYAVTVAAIYTDAVVLLPGTPGPSSSPPALLTTFDKPSPPTSVVATSIITTGATTGNITVTWQAATPRGSAVLHYTVIPSPACGACTGVATVAGTSTIVKGLTVKTTYTFTVTATNTVGTSTPSPPSNHALSIKVPLAPTIGAVTPTHTTGAVHVTWTAGTTQGATITAYTVVPNTVADCIGTVCAGTIVRGSPAGTSATISNLVLNPQKVDKFKVIATNIVGTSAASATSAAVTPAIAPNQVTSVKAKATLTGAKAPKIVVTWTDHTTKANGATITGYLLTATPILGGGTTITKVVVGKTSVTGTITGGSIAAGVTYDVTVSVQFKWKGTAATLTGAPSTPPAVVTTENKPSPPTSVVATSIITTGATTGNITVTWQAATPRGSAVLHYTVIPSPACGACTGVATVAGTSTIVKGLTVKTTYTFTVTATNTVGTSTPSPPSNHALSIKVPLAPTIGAVTPTHTTGAVHVTWTAGTTQGATITAYTVVPNTVADCIGTVCAGTIVRGSPAGTSATISNLVLNPQKVDKFKVIATNIVGTSAASATSAAVTPAVAPNQVTSVKAKATLTGAKAPKIVVTWTDHTTKANGATITGYLLTATPILGGGTTITKVVVGKTIVTGTITGGSIAAGVTYDVTVSVQFKWKGTAATLTGAPSTPPAIVTTENKPSPPTSVVATSIITTGATTGNITVTWQAATPRGSAVLHYTVIPSPACGACTGVATVAGTSTIVKGLTVKTTYTFTVTATNTVGTSTPSPPSNHALSIKVPLAPTIGAVTPTHTTGAVHVTWTAGTTQGATITAYTVVPNTVADCIGTVCAGTIVRGSPAGTSATISNLVLNPQKVDKFKVIATNIVGTSAASATSAAVTPAIAPNQVTSVKAKATLTGAKAPKIVVTWTDHTTKANGATITGYLLTATPILGGGTTITKVVVGKTIVTGTITGGSIAAGVTYDVTVSVQFKWKGTAATLTGAPSTPPAVVTTENVPSAPTSLVATSLIDNSGDITLTWQKPATNGSPITTYTVVTTGTCTSACLNTTVTGPTPATTVTLTPTTVGFKPGNSYTFTVYATNTVTGHGPTSPPSNPAKSLRVPLSPINVVATANHVTGAVHVTWAEPAGGTNGATITRYTVDTFVTTCVTSTPTTCFTFTSPTFAGSVTRGSPAGTSTTITGLTYGDHYAFKVYATNIVGASTTSTFSNYPVIPAIPPDVPTNVTATATLTTGKTPKIDVTWSAPTTDNGAVLIGYVLTATPVTGKGTTSVRDVLTPGTTTGTLTTTLSPGVTYDVTVADEYSFTGIIGFHTGIPSSPPVVVTTENVPLAPYDVVATSLTNGTGDIALTWQAPATRGSTILHYTVNVTGTCTGTCTGTTTVTSTGTIVSNLIPGNSYTFRVTATNTVGTSASSSPSNVATSMTVPAAPFTVTSKPTHVTGSVKVSWSAPATHGAKITSYTVTPTPPCATCKGLVTRGNPAGTSTTISGLTYGTTYAFIVTAHNIVGTSTPSSTTLTTTTSIPAIPPALATNLKATALITGSHPKISVTWTDPATANGAIITGYLITATPSAGGVSVTHLVLGAGAHTGSLASTLVAGIPYNVTVSDEYHWTTTATTRIGLPSTPPVVVTTDAVPSSAPEVQATALGTSVGHTLVTWPAPSTHGSVITKYTVTPSPLCLACGGLTVLGSPPVTHTIVTGLTPGTVYTFTVTATNALGTGLPSAPSNQSGAIGTPDAPTGVVAGPGGSQAHVVWASPDYNFAPILRYTVSLTPKTCGSNCPPAIVKTVTGQAPNTTATFSGLAYGVTYSATVTATNSAGTGPASVPVTFFLPAASQTEGYWITTNSGQVFAYGSALYYGDAAQFKRTHPIIGIVSTSTSGGYWQIGSDGGVYSFGDAGFFGSTGSTALNQPVVAMAHTGDNLGYWEVASDGGLFAFGDANYYGSLPGLHVAVHNIVGMIPTLDGKGYWEVGSDGGVFAFGDAGFFHSLPGLGVHVSDIVGIVPTANDQGYWLVGSDGGVFAFGNAGFFGSLGDENIESPIAGLAATPTGAGYWLVSQNGNVYTEGDAVYQGSPLETIPGQQVVGIASAGVG